MNRTHRKFSGISEGRLSLDCDDRPVPTVERQTQVRDVAVRKLRDVTVAVALVAAASAGLIAWVSAATIPGATATTGLTGNAVTGDEAPLIPTNQDGFGQKPPGKNKFGPGVAVSGGSR